MTVYLVGAGPGDPGLLTVRGAELLASAQVVVYDRLSAAELLDLAPASARRIAVGKQPGGHSVPQDEINELLVELGRQNLFVVRLKGGDPFVFARGAEEADALATADVDYEVVPGISSAIAVPAYAGIPVTMRYSSTSLTIVTGHEDPTKQRTEVGWEALAQVGGTIVILMGVANIEAISQRLVAGGLDPDTPAVAIRWGTRPQQEVIRSSIGSIANEPLRSPSTIVVGRVAAANLDWFTSRPLLGKKVAVTRSPDQVSHLASKLTAKGAEVIPVPTIQIVDPLDDGRALRSAVERIRDYDWVIVTSPNGARRFCAELRDGRDLAGVKISAIGPGTAEALEECGLIADLIPSRYVAEGLLEEFPYPEAGTRSRVLMPRAETARDVLPDGLRERGWKVDIVDAYRTVPAELTGSQMADLTRADAVTFTSSSSVRNLVAAVGASGVTGAVVTIGPITSSEATAAGLNVAAEADPHTLDALVEAVTLALGDGDSPTAIGS